MCLHWNARLVVSLDLAKQCGKQVITAVNVTDRINSVPPRNGCPADFLTSKQNVCDVRHGGKTRLEVKRGDVVVNNDSDKKKESFDDVLTNDVFNKIFKK